MKTLKNKQGVSLLIVVMYFMVLTILLGGLFYVTIGNFNNQNKADSHATAFYVAESGINLTLGQFEDEINTLLASPSINPTSFNSSMDALATSINGTSIDSESLDPFSTDIGNAYADITITTTVDGEGYHIYTIISEGYVDGESRTLGRVVQLQYAKATGAGFSTDKAILVDGSITIQNNAVVFTNDEDVTADIATYDTTTGAITLTGQADVTGTIYLLPDADADVVSGAPLSQLDFSLIDEELPIISFVEIDERVDTVMAQASIPKLPLLTDANFLVNSAGSIISDGASGYTYNISPSTGEEGGYYVPSFSITDADLSNPVTINVTGDTLIVTDSLNLSGAINFVGTGKLEIYVRDSSPLPLILGDISLKSVIGNINDPENLIVYVKHPQVAGETPPTFEVPGNTKLSGSFMFDFINLDVGNNSAIDGYILTNGENVYFSNGSDLSTGGLYYAPNALVTLNNLATLVGSIVSKDVFMSQNSSVEYVPMQAGDMPFILIDPETGQPYSGGFVFNYIYNPVTEVD